MSNYYRINTDYGKHNPDSQIVNSGYPYVWGDRISKSSPATTAVLNILSEIKAGDIIVAGSSSIMNRIGIAKSSPLFVMSTKEDGFVKEHNGEEYSFNNADKYVDDLFLNISVKGYIDVIVVPVQWIWKDEGEKTKSQGQGTMCRIKNQEIIDKINQKINSYNNNKM